MAEDYACEIPGAPGPVPEKTLGISHGSEEAGPLASFGGTLPVTKVDLTKREAVSGTETPGVP